MLGGAGALLGAAAVPAYAGEVAYATKCVPPPISGLPPVEGTTKVEISAPSTAKVGDEVEVVWTFVQAASRNPDLIDLPADSVQPSGTLRAAGAQTADIAMKGPRENPAIPKGAPMVLSTMKGTLKLTAPGAVTLTPDAYAIDVYSTETRCAPAVPVAAGATIDVTGGGGTSGGSGTSGTTGTSGSTSSGGTTEGGTTGGTTTSGTTSGGTTAGGTTTSGTTSGGTASGGTTDGGTTDGGATDGGTASGGTDGGGSATGGGGGGQTDFPGKEVRVPYDCVTPIGDRSVVSPVQIDATKDGGSYDLTVRFRKSVMDSPADIPADSVKPAMEIVLGGADTGSVRVEGPTNAEPIKAGDPMEIPDLTGTYKPGASGESTLAPGVLTIKALGTTTTCTPAESLVSLTLDTQEQPGGAAGGSSSPGSVGGGSASGSGTASGGATGGGLADTGVDGGQGTLKALALVAGTTALLGGAVFTFMPRRYLR
ncbi:hypothetical protein [Streptomyces heilongjiangensis]|uniref:Gram-positive cocci surface proteins LPxTG domain-containing protein n=1 Tax=Streptomyces heilongjiangensis TaxID=945052 RepID=A0ABW1BIA8_9ACTN|nr:hypothetical protein [Streptomyces heilongjiangensis]MDC2948590.1 hypothetical protein [Streptomyces heilongjiangensis]